MDDLGIINMDGWSEEEKKAFYGEYVSTLVVNYLTNLKEDGYLDDAKLSELSKNTPEVKSLDDLSNFYDLVLKVSEASETNLIKEYQETSTNLNNGIKYNYIKGLIAYGNEERPEVINAYKKSEETGDHSYLLNLVINK